ncbi:hypothetical protein FQR65_LT18069 [Abscondita terminalis]|nr:hypothetical protein FQR65_LT18069 [Abscondita terminalis]
MYWCQGNLTKAAGFYNTMLQSDEPCLIIETLNGYRLKEKLPDNLGEFTVPVGKIEITKEGKDATVVTYGSTWRIVMEAADELEKLGVNIEVNRYSVLIAVDISAGYPEKWGDSIYSFNKVIDKQKAFKYLDAEPLTIAATRPTGVLGFVLTSCGTQKKLEALQADYQKCLTDGGAKESIIQSQISIYGSMNIEKLIGQIKESQDYIKRLQDARSRQDSLNIAISNKLKRSLDNLNDQDINIKVQKGVVFISLSDKMLYKSGSYEILPTAETTKFGVNPSRMTAGGRSEFVPKADNNSLMGKADNRRTEIIVLPKLDQFMQLLEAKR